MTKSLSAPPQDRELASIPLNLIKHVSRFNPRAGDASDAGQMAASLLANGQLQPLLVTSECGVYAVLDGQHRWRAMRILAAQGHWPSDQPVSCEVRRSPEPGLREIALAVNTIRRALHPVEEYRAFDALIRAGVDETRIANDFGLGMRHVRQRLALGRLAPKILDAWREGKITADAAQAFTLREDHAAQEAAFETLIAAAAGRGIYRPEVRRLLLAGSMPSDCREALYVGAGAYLAAGGEIRQDLFSDESSFLDRALLRKLAKEKLNADCATIADLEGWGFFETGDLPAGHKTETISEDFTAAELSRLEEINSAAEQTAALENEREAIELRGYLRAIPQARRAGLGLFALLDFEGRPLFTRGLLPQEANNDPASAQVASGRGKKGAAAKSSQAAAPLSKEFFKTPRAILDAAIKAAFFQSIVKRPDVAVMIAVAALGSSADFECPADLKNARSWCVRDCFILQKIRDRSFNDAIAFCQDTELRDLEFAFAELIGRSIRTDVSSLSSFAFIAAAISASGVALDEHLVKAFDYEAYFAAASKKARQQIANEIDAVSVEATGTKSIAAEILSESARREGWLPEPLKSWAHVRDRKASGMEEKPLAEAMDEALADAAPAAGKTMSRRKKSARAMPAGE